MRPNQCEVVVPIDRKAVPLDAALQRLVHCFQKIIAMRLNMETEEIRAQQSIEEFPLPRTDPEGFRVGPRNVPENCYPGVGALRFYKPGQQGEMVVLDQHERLFRLFDLLQYDLREFLIHALIVFPILRAKHRTRMRDMAKRPDSLVREPQIVSFLLFLGEPEAAECVTRMVRRNAQPVICIDGFPVRIRGAMCDPRAIAGAQNRLEGGNQAARGHAGLDSFAAVDMFVRLTIGDYE